MGDPRFKLIEQLFAEHAGSLQEFFRRRLRHQWNAPDLTQEVYIRMLRVSDYKSIENPEAYLFTVASNLLKECAVIERKQAASRVALSDPVATPALVADSTLERDMDQDVRERLLHEAVRELPERLQAVVVWVFQEGLTQEAIGQRLGVSRRMARKYLAAAMAHCRRRLISKGAK